jgi:hypothetical protein
MNDILQYKNYYASVNFSAADEVFYGKLLGINDLVSFEGASVKELVRRLESRLIKPTKALLTYGYLLPYIKRHHFLQLFTILH